MAKSSSSSGGNWVTINGVHILIGANGKIEKGPAKFIGSTVDDMKKSGKSTADRKAELQKKKEAKSKNTSTSTKKEGDEDLKSSAYYRAMTDDIFPSFKSPNVLGTKSINKSSKSTDIEPKKESQEEINKRAEKFAKTQGDFYRMGGSSVFGVVQETGSKPVNSPAKKIPYRC